MNNNISGINPTGTPSALNVQNAGEQAISFKEQLPDLAAKLRDALTSKFNESPLFGQRETAVQGFLNQPSQTRADISQMQQTSGVPLSLTQQQSIESARRSAAYVPLATNTMMMGSAYGGLEDMMKTGVDAFTAASQATSERANLINDLRKQEIDRQFKEQGIALDWAKLAATQQKDTEKVMKDQTEKANLLKTQRDKVKSIKDIIASGKAPTGLIPGLKFQITKRLGGASAQQTQLSTAYSDFNTRLFEIAGKAFTGPEKDLLQGMVLQLGNAPDFTLNQLDQIDQLLYDEQMRQAAQFLNQ
jgi:hypothetical protein